MTAEPVGVISNDEFKSFDNYNLVNIDVAQVFVGVVIKVYWLAIGLPYVHLR